MIKANRHTFEQLNDGKLFFGEKKTLRDSRKKEIGKEFVKIGELFFKTITFKNSDVLERFGIDKKVDVKIKCYNTNQLKNSHIIKIDDEDYQIIQIDLDYNKTHVFLYLQKESERS